MEKATHPHIEGAATHIGRNIGMNPKSHIDRFIISIGLRSSSLKRSRWAYHILRLFLGAIFLYASHDKILHPQEFAEAVYNYQILPDAMVNLVALVLPWIELLLGLCLLIGIWMPGATVISTGLLGIFIGAMIFNQVRGIDIHCGCFSTEGSGDPIGMMWTALRDMGFLLLSVYLTARVISQRPAGR